MTETPPSAHLWGIVMLTEAAVGGYTRNTPCDLSYFVRSYHATAKWNVTKLNYKNVNAHIAVTMRSCIDALANVTEKRDTSRLWVHFKRVIEIGSLSIAHPREFFLRQIIEDVNKQGCFHQGREGLPEGTMYTWQVWL